MKGGCEVTTAEFDLAIIDAAREALLQSDAMTAPDEGTPEFYYVDVANIDYLILTVLSAAVDALKGAILAPVAALADRWESSDFTDEATHAAHDLRAVIADPDAVAKHNKAERADAHERGYDAGYDDCFHDLDYNNEGRNPYLTTEGTDASRNSHEVIDALAESRARLLGTTEGTNQEKDNT